MAGAIRGVAAAILLGWPTLAAAQAKTTPEVQAICLEEVTTRVGYHVTPDHRAALLRRAGTPCCQEMGVQAARLSPLQRGLVWAKLDEQIALMTKQSHHYRATQETISRLQAQLTLPQASAARALIVDRAGCYRRFRGG